MQKFKLISSDIVYENPRFKIRKDNLIWPDGSPGEFFLIEREPSVLIIAEQDGKLLIEEQYRYPIDSLTIEFPAGALNSGETPEEAARRELLEETGYAASELKSFGFMHTVGELKLYLFTARGLSRVTEPQLEASEIGLTSRWIPVAEFRKMIADRTITRSSTLAAWALYCAIPLLIQSSQIRNTEPAPSES